MDEGQKQKIRKLLALALDPNARGAESASAWNKLLSVLRSQKIDSHEFIKLLGGAPESAPPGTVVMPFGPYAGKPIREVAKTEKGQAYLNDLMVKAHCPVGLRMIILHAMNSF